MKNEKRRFTRVHFRGDIGRAQRILGAKVVWPNREVSDVFDISFKGVAVSRPGLVDLRPNTTESLRLELGEKTPFVVPARIAWVSEQQLGMEFGDLSAEAHLTLHEFLSDKLVGQHLASVDRKFFAADATFDHWYWGPSGTHVFIWCDRDDSTRVLKVAVEFSEEEVWEFENRRVTKGEHLSVRALQLLGQLVVSDFHLRDVIEKVAASA